MYLKNIFLCFIVIYFIYNAAFIRPFGARRNYSLLSFTAHHSRRAEGDLALTARGKLLPDDNSCCSVALCGTDTQHCLDHKHREERVWWFGLFFKKKGVNLLYQFTYFFKCCFAFGIRLLGTNQIDNSTKWHLTPSWGCKIPAKDYWDHRTRQKLLLIHEPVLIYPICKRPNPKMFQAVEGTRAL